ncbi:hypothetical protein E2C01_080336 [Portunus trituberculatus]|uniref:Uncharacterized protein n=1 Tax=Portunus trituberculatus TaxID=210409 RepID=A0A5B7ISY5_PORTR|nr:hypothetical protein [Portunus trituberculatus]
MTYLAQEGVEETGDSVAAAWGGGSRSTNIGTGLATSLNTGGTTAAALATFRGTEALLEQSEFDQQHSEAMAPSAHVSCLKR